MWLTSLAETSKDDQAAILDFLHECFSNVLKDPFTYQDRVTDLIMAGDEEEQEEEQAGATYTKNLIDRKT